VLAGPRFNPLHHTYMTKKKERKAEKKKGRKKKKEGK
jgi:hypothetical protein